jgi:hypothetical protein
LSRRAATLLVAGAALVLLAGLFFWVRSRESAPTGADAAPVDSPTRVEAARPESWVATLWLPSESQKLDSESATVTSLGGAEQRATAVVAALLAARPSAPRAAVFPAPVALGRLLLVGGTAFVDLRPEDGGEIPPAGSTLELLRVYSIVHTVTRNVPEVERVVLLWNGVQRPGFPGHVDTGRALVPMAALEGG